MKNLKVMLGNGIFQGLFFMLYLNAKRLEDVFGMHLCEKSL